LSAFLFLAPASLFASETPNPVASIWINSGPELLSLTAAPFRGTWPDYFWAAGIGGGLALALNNDPDWYQDVQIRRSDLQDKLMPVASLLGDGWFHIGGYAALYTFGGERDRQASLAAAEGQIGVAVVSILVKLAFTAARPGNSEAQRRWFTLNPGDNSFPSGHSMTAFCAAAVLGRAYQAEWLAYSLAGLVAYSRIYNQKHWPADVIAGAGLGLLIGNVVVNYHERRRPDTPFLFSTAPQDDGIQVRLTWRY